MLNFCKKIFTLAIVLSISSMAQAETAAISITLLSTPQDIQNILNLQQKMLMSKKPKEISKYPRATCFAANINNFLTKDLSNPKTTYGCIFSDQVTMNSALLRAGLFVHTEAGMATDAQLYNSKLMTAVGGHDFSGQQLIDYCKQAHIPATTLHEHKQLKAIEQEFYTQVLKPILDKNQSNFIFFAVVNTKKFKENLSHELLHAQYYNTPQIANILDQVWQKVPAKDQTVIINCLREGGYDINQHELLLREFYSYFLQYNAAKYLAGIPVLRPMAPLANTYAKKIRTALEKHQIKVLTVMK